MSDKPPVRLAMLGASHGHASGKTRWLRDLPDIDFVGVYEPKAAMRATRETALEYQHVAWIESIGSILDDESIVGVVIGGAEEENPPYARRALAAGKHVLMEKACGWTKGHADELIGGAEERGLLFQMGYNFRLLPHIRRVLDMARDGEFGSVYAVRTHMGSPFASSVLHLGDGQPYFRGGMMYNLGCHALDMVVAVLGAPRAVHPHFLSVHPESREAGYADYVLAVLEYENARATIEVSLVETEGRLPRSLEVFGTDAQAIASPFMPAGAAGPAVAVHQGGAQAGPDGWRQYGPDPYEPFRADVEEFAACIRGEKEPRFGYGHDRAVQYTLMDICGESAIKER